MQSSIVRKIAPLINGIFARLCPHFSNQSQTVAHTERHFVKAQRVLLTKRASDQHIVGCFERQSTMFGDEPAKFLPPFQKGLRKPKTIQRKSDTTI